jgi:tellurium resistance protein TerZ
MITLGKGQTVDLSKQARKLSTIRMGLGWDAARRLFGLFGGGAIDLDASCIAFDDRKTAVDLIWFRQLASRDGSIWHSGDNLTGDGDGDDETITVNLLKLPSSIRHLAFTVNSFTGQTFNQVENAVARLVDDGNGEKEIARFVLSEKGAHTGVIMAVLSNNAERWTMQAIGKPANGRTVHDLIPAVVEVL